MTQAAAQKRDERFDVNSHYGFGENWADYSKHIDEAKIAMAEEGLWKLLPSSTLEGKTFLDIGCGSGLHTLSALRSGIKGAACIDIDPHSVATTEAVLKRFWPGDNYVAFEHNILSDTTDRRLPVGGFDIVYSWGVLHHTGDMWAAVEKAAHYVAPGGKFVIALYKKSPLCNFWRAEKKLYTNVPALRPVLNAAYMALYCGIKVALGQNPVRYIRDYEEERGMRFITDVKDWLGGYPYESATADEVQAQVEAMGFTLERSYNIEAPKGGGILGSGCGEYVFKRNDS